MNFLPHEIVQRILEYNGSIKYRNGIYINQISHDDYRYVVLKQIPRIFIMDHPDYFCRVGKIGSRNFLFEKKVYPFIMNEPMTVIVNYCEENHYEFIQNGIWYDWIIYKTPQTLLQFLLGILISFIKKCLNL